MLFQFTPALSNTGIFCFLAASSDHPFLRMYADLEKLSVEDNKVAGPLVPRRTTEEEDMAYFEKRYQERVGY